MSKAKHINETLVEKGLIKEGQTVVNYVEDNWGPEGKKGEGISRRDLAKHLEQICGFFVAPSTIWAIMDNAHKNGKAKFQFQGKRGPKNSSAPRTSTTKTTKTERKGIEEKRAAKMEAEKKRREEAEKKEARAKAKNAPPSTSTEDPTMKRVVMDMTCRECGEKWKRTESVHKKDPNYPVVVKVCRCPKCNEFGTATASFVWNGQILTKALVNSEEHPGIKIEAFVDEDMNPIKFKKDELALA